MKLDKIIASENAFKSDDPYDIINSNITVINLLREEGAKDEIIHEDALGSYYLDYYQAQYTNGNFHQFVWNSGWQEEINKSIQVYLEKIGAHKHLALFIEQRDKVNRLDKEELESFLKEEYFGQNPTRDKLANDLFFQLDEDIIALNSKWLKTHPKLEVLSIENMFLALEKVLNKKIER